MVVCSPSPCQTSSLQRDICQLLHFFLSPNRCACRALAFVVVLISGHDMTGQRVDFDRRMNALASFRFVAMARKADRFVRCYRDINTRPAMADDTAQTVGSRSGRMTIFAPRNPAEAA
jgi:hypothetical protein